MKPINAIVLLLALVTGLAAAAPAAAEAPTASVGNATAVYCVYKDPVVVQGTTVYPGGRYCVPGP